MQDLFEKEAAVLERAKSFLNNMADAPARYHDEFANMTFEYECLLRQARLMLRCADLTTLGLNADKKDLLDKVNVDELTGIYNRRFIEENLPRYHKILSRTDGCISLLMLDIDFFKKYNDTYGHMAGDICLRKVAAALQKTVSRAEDFVARYGGEEFLVVLSNTSKEGAMLLAQRILENIQNLAIPHVDSEVADCVTISIGVMSACVSHRDDYQQYIKCADIALYASKRKGRNRVTFSEFEGKNYDR